jgi:hypothetical protein
MNWINTSSIPPSRHLPYFPSEDTVVSKSSSRARTAATMSSAMPYQVFMLVLCLWGLLIGFLCEARELTTIDASDGPGQRG